MRRWFLIGTLCFALLAPIILDGQTPNGGPVARNSAPSLQPSNPPAAVPQDQQPTSVRPMSTSPRQSYQREDHPHRRSHISKKEIVFMGAIAGTSMGIGAIAGGGTGLAIGAIVGGWGAYAGHRFWHWFNH